jgi:periplasmic divalent cation tolerance protein
MAAGYVVVLVTAANEEEAGHITEILLQTKKAACVNMVHGVRSYFWWNGKIDNADETLLIIKTKTNVLPELIDLIKETHSYTVPEVIALPIIAGNEDYLEWINVEVND